MPRQRVQGLTPALSSASSHPAAGYSTAADVARLAGVSEATVSLVANGKVAGRVSLQNQERVHQAIAQLGYRVDPFARGLATGRRHLVALVTPDIADPFFSRVAMGVTQALGGQYQLLLVATGDPASVAPPQLEDILSMRVDGILIESTAAALLGLRYTPCPMVTLDAPGAGVDGPAVEFDIRAGAQMLADHLVRLGHRSFGYLDWAGESPTFATRRDAFAESLERAPRRQRLLRTGRSRIQIQDATAAFRRLWPSWQAAGVTAVVCATDQQAYGVLRGAKSAGIAVPRDVSVAGFNDLEFSVQRSRRLLALTHSHEH